MPLDAYGRNSGGDVRASNWNLVSIRHCKSTLKTAPTTTNNTFTVPISIYSQLKLPLKEY